MDDATLQFYRSNAEAYAQREITSRKARMTAFLAKLTPGAFILELGCGAGGRHRRDAGAGFCGSRHRRIAGNGGGSLTPARTSVETLLFDQLDETETYDAVWANACLLHVPRPELAGVLARISKALKPGGIFFASYKTGEADGRDTLNRYYNYPSSDWLRATYAEAGDWSELSIDTGEVKGFDDKPASMLFVIASKPRN